MLSGMQTGVGDEGDKYEDHDDENEDESY